MKFTEYLNESYTKKNELNEGQEIDWNYNNGFILKELNRVSKASDYDYSFSEKNGTLFATSKAKYGINFKVDSNGNITIDKKNSISNFNFGSIFDRHFVDPELDGYRSALRDLQYMLTEVHSTVRFVLTYKG